MARSDLLLNLVKAATRGDRTLLRRTLTSLITEERAKNHGVLASRLEEFLNGEWASEQARKCSLVTDDRVNGLVYEVTPEKNLDDLILPDHVVISCRQLIAENQRRDLLASHNLEPRHRILLVGPPGNGKTSLAHAIAKESILPLYVVRYEGLIGSYLGETAARLGKLFQFVRTRPSVLFMDEFETLGKERGDIHDTGEVKRVVSSLLLQIDDLPSHVMVITATNHQELLDRAVWRRFQLRLDLPAPTRSGLERWFEKFEKRIGQALGLSPRILADRLKGLSYAEAEDFAVDVFRRYVLSIPDGDLKSIVKNSLSEWSHRARPE